MKKNFFGAGLLALALILGGCSGKEGIGYAGEDLSGRVLMERPASGDTGSIGVNVDGGWQLYGINAEGEPEREPTLAGEGAGSHVLPVVPGRRTYFQFVNGNNRAVVAERRLRLDGGYNFRDLGGYEGEGGRHVKWGVFFRSDALDNLSDADLSYIGMLGVASAVDFRAVAEAAEAPDKLIPGATYYPLPIAPGDMSGIGTLGDTDAETLGEYMKDLNRELVTAAEFIAQYREFFRLLQDEANVPLVFHCSAGKDRTGMGAALILFALGADEETVMRDYMMSNRYIKEKYAAQVGENPALEPLFSVREEYLRAGIDKIREVYGSVEGFLKNELQVDVPGFRKLYLE